MEIRLATLSDLPRIEDIYREAREFMKTSGNASQWGTTYPERELLLSDIKGRNLYTVVENEDILGVFYFRIGEDPTYRTINGGAWKNNLPYGVIHRIAVGKNAHGKGVSRFCFDYAFGLSGNLKIDTHRDNAPMRRALEKYGFEYCGVIHLENGDERIAFQKIAK